jgi:hypothetical protein
VAAALALNALAFTWTQKVGVDNFVYCWPDGECKTFVVTYPNTLYTRNMGEFLVGGALLVCFGAIIDGRFGWSRVAPLVMVLTGALFCLGVTWVAGGIWVNVLFAGFIVHDNLAIVYRPTAVVSGVCALVALLPRQLFGIQKASA